MASWRIYFGSTVNEVSNGYRRKLFHNMAMNRKSFITEMSVKAVVMKPVFPARKETTASMVSVINCRSIVLPASLKLAKRGLTFAKVAGCGVKILRQESIKA